MLVLRVALGAVLIAHGWPKIKDLKQNAKNFYGMGFKPGIFWGSVAAILEFFGGILLILGFFTAPVAFLLAGQFVVIIFWKLSKNMPLVGGWEFDLLILAGLLVLLSLGAGPYALDRMFYWSF